MRTSCNIVIIVLSFVWFGFGEMSRWIHGATIGCESGGSVGAHEFWGISKHFMCQLCLYLEMHCLTVETTTIFQPTPKLITPLSELILVANLPADSAIAETKQISWVREIILNYFTYISININKNVPCITLTFWFLSPQGIALSVD